MDIIFKINDEIVTGRFIFRVDGIPDVAGLLLDKEIIGFSKFILIYILPDQKIEIDPVMEELYPEASSLLVTAIEEYLKTSPRPINHSINLCRNQVV